MTWDYGTLASEVYELDKPIGHSFGDVEYYTRQLADVTGRILKPEPMRYWRRDPHLWTLQTMHIDYDPAANQTTRFLRYEKWTSGSLIATELQLFRLQYWSIHEFGDLLEEAGFTDIKVTSDYQDQAPTPGSETWTFHATRPLPHASNKAPPQWDRHARRLAQSSLLPAFSRILPNPATHPQKIGEIPGFGEDPVRHVNIPI